MDIADFWARFRRDSSPGVAKYAQLRGIIMEAIAAGYWKRGDQLPTEQDLAHQTPFSLGTVQRALRSLVEDGIIVRKQGSGTFVSDNTSPLKEPWHMRFVPPDGGDILPTYTYALRRHFLANKGPWSRHFPNRKNLFLIERRFRIGDQFWVFNRFIANADVLKPLCRIPLSKLNGVNLKVLIAQDYKLPVTAIEHRLRLEKLSPEICKQIEAKRGSTGLMMEAIAKTGQDVLYYQEFYIPETEYYLDLPSSYS